jgi:tRNA(fMet)-specific endonuclease VapC
MRYMLDTDTASYIIKGSHPALDRRLASVRPTEVCISSVTRAELLYGVHRKPDAPHLARVVAQFPTTIQSLPWDNEAAERFGRIAAELDAAGKRIGTFDTMIAAHAVAAGTVIVTNNVEHFSRVFDLTVENWASGAQI